LIEPSRIYGTRWHGNGPLGSVAEDLYPGRAPWKSIGAEILLDHLRGDRKAINKLVDDA
jgi:hypothetical protein